MKRSYGQSPNTPKLEAIGYQNDSSCAFVVCFGDGLEPLLTSSIPNLHLDLRAVTIDCLDLEIDPNGRDVGHLVLLIDKAQ